jgi:hypothetical protein
MGFLGSLWNGIKSGIGKVAGIVSKVAPVVSNIAGMIPGGGFISGIANAAGGIANAINGGGGVQGIANALQGTPLGGVANTVARTSTSTAGSSSSAITSTADNVVVVFFAIEMSSRKAQRYDDSSSSSSSSDSEPPPKKRKAREPVEKAVKAPARSRLPQAKRMQVIELFQKGHQDPEYSCNKSATGRYIVKRRKMPIDQSPHLDVTAGQSPMKIPELQRAQTAPIVEPVEEKPKKEDLQLSWINMQATVNDSLKRDLESLSEKYERLAQKEERRKKEKAKAKAKVQPPQKTPVPTVPPPSQPVYSVPPTQTWGSTPKPQPQLRAGQYRRATPMLISRF